MSTVVTHPGFRRACTLMLVPAMLLLAGCSSFSGLWGGGDDDTILPGERITVMPQNEAIAVDPSVASKPVAIPAAQTNASWSQPGGSPSNAPQHVALGGELRKLWTANAGRGSSSQGRLTASPIVAGGRVFVLDTEATVHAFDASSGKRLWSSPLTPEGEEPEEGYGGGLASDNGRLFAAIGFGHVVALDPASGGRIWDKPLGVPIRAAPTASDGRVFVLTVNNEVYSLSQSDGEIAWKFQGVAESAGLLSSTSPAVGEGKVVVPYTSGEIVAFSAGDGNPAWADSLTKAGALSSLANINDIAGRPVIDRGMAIAISHSGRMSAVRMQTGERLWSQNIGGTQTPWVAGDYVFVVSLRGTLTAIERKGGAVRWVRELGSGQQWSGPVLAGGRLILVSSEGSVVSVAPQTGAVISKVDLGEPMLIAPVVAGNTIYFLTDDAQLIAMR